MGTEHLGKHTDLCLSSPRCPSRATCDHHHPNEPAPPSTSQLMNNQAD